MSNFLFYSYRLLMVENKNHGRQNVLDINIDEIWFTVYLVKKKLFSKIQNGRKIQRQIFFLKKKLFCYTLTKNTSFLSPFFSRNSKWQINQNGELIYKIFDMLQFFFTYLEFL
jgi:hypothetical protein